MKKKLLLLGMTLLFAWGQSFSQVLNQPANWPNAGWSLTGTYNATSLLANPTIDANLSYDDDDAGFGSTSDVIEAASPVIDLTAAQAAGENYLYIDYEYDYNAGDLLQFEYWDADAGLWVLWETLPENSNALSAWCNELTGVQTTSQQLDISAFTATQLSGFQYRVYYDASSTWGWGFCMSSPTIYSTDCPFPTSLIANNATSSSVDLSWINGGTETQWNIEYGPTGFTPGTGTVVPVGTNPFTLTSLNSATTYDVYVQANCGGSVSSFSGSTTFSTLIAPLVCSSGINTNLFSSDFETSFPASWTNTATGNPQWEFNTGGTGSSNTGPSAAHSGSGYIFLETSGGSIGDADTIYPSSSLDLTQSLNEARITFYYHMYGADMGDLLVQVSTDGGATWTTEFSQSGQVQTAETDPWVPASINLNAYIGSIIDYRIVGVRGSSFESDMAIDLFNIETCVSCPQPTDLNVTNITASTADLGWQLGNTETQWIIEYDTANFVVGTGNTMVTTNNPETLTGLMDNTEYDVYVRAICGPGDTSSYSIPASFITPCVIFNAPYEESFDGSAWVPGTNFNNTDSEISGCWSNNPSNTGFFWGTGTGTTPSGSTGPANDVSGSGNYVFTEGSSGSTGDVAILTSPVIDLSTVVDPYLTFSYHMYGSNVDSLTVEISNDNGTTWDTIVNIYGAQQTDNTDPWADTSVALTSFATDDVMIRFLNVRSGFNSDIAIDEFSVLPCIGSAGQDGSVDVCRFDTLVNLNTAITPDQDGAWSFPLDQNLIVNGNQLNVLLLPAGDYEVYYIANGACENDTAVANVTVFNGSNAGNNGSLQVCQNQPVNLFDGLTGNVDLGGTWLDPSNNPIPGSQPVASSIPGSYNYDYIASNGVCPADTALVEVIVDSDCDYLSLGEEKLNELTVFPNPATNVINISNPSNSESLRVEILDMNGRVVLTDAKALANATEGSIDISHLVNGMYTLRIYNEEGQKTFKVVIQ